MMARRLVSRLAALAACLCSLLGVWASAAQAAPYELASQFGSFSNVRAVGVDQSAGDVYVYDQGASSIYKYNSLGEPESFSSTGSNVVGGVAGWAGGGESEIAVDNSGGPANGDFYFANDGTAAPRVFASSGQSLGEIQPEAGKPWGPSCGIAVDPAGNVYVSFTNGDVNRYKPEASGTAMPNYRYTGSLYGLLNEMGGGEICEIAVDSTGDVYATLWGKNKVYRFEASQFNESETQAKGAEAAPNAEALAVDPSTNDVFINNGSEVLEYGPGNEAPLIETIGNKAGLFNSSAVAVRAATHNLYVGSTEHVLVFSNLALPTVRGETVREVGISSAQASVEAKAHGLPTTYKVEYGTDASYGQSVPVPNGSAGSETGYRTVTQTLSGLQPGTTYHFRFVFTNSEGTTYGEDETFNTFPAIVSTPDACPNSEVRTVQFSSYLPQCRAYELVSPPDKTGGDITTDPMNTRSATSGDAVKFESTSGFGDARGMEIQGTSYIAQRGAEGWVTHGITPPQAGTPKQTVYGSSLYLGFSDDLSKGVFFADSPVSPGRPNVEAVTNLYVRNDLLDGGAGHYELLSDSAEPLPASESSKLEFAGASADWKYLLFESARDLTPEAKGLSTEAPKLYEWHDGTVTLAGVLPDSACAAPPCPASESVAGEGSFHDPYHTQERHSISDDGSRVLFVGGPLSPEHNPYNGGTGYHEPFAGNLYMRIDGRETIQLNVSERKEPDTTDPVPATFEGANAEDSEAFFVSQQALTDDASPGGGLWLYRYDYNAPAGEHLTLISKTEVGEGADAHAIVGMSQDASYIYFLARKRLVSGQSMLEEEELYVWHDGTVRPIVSRMATGEYREERWGDAQAAEGDGFRASADGKIVMFKTASREAAGAVGYDNEGNDQTCKVAILLTFTKARFCEEIYVYDYDTNKLSCASCNPTGVPPTSEPSFESVANSMLERNYTQYLNHPLTSDGRYVFFNTAEALVPQDIDGHNDVYEYETTTGELHLISGGTCGCDSFFSDASASGNDVFFTTAQKLVYADTDSSVDLYDARVEGGIPSQNRPPVVACAGEECQGPVPSPPSFSVPGSAAFSGPGNGSTVKVTVKKVKHKARKHRKRHRRRKPRGSRKNVHKRAGR